MKASIHTLLLVFLLSPVLACKEAQKMAAAPASAPAVAPLPAPEVAALQRVLADYEGLRALLANDETNGMPALASTLATRTSTLARSSSARLAPRLEQISRRAKELEKAAGASIGAARLAFGELSREVVTLLAMDPALQGKLHVFECGMAEGYQKWVQPGEALENPYMGQAMLGCGSKTSWVP